jgi:hypothetical protein
MNTRPQTLAEVATRSDTLDRFGRELQDWLHTVRSTRSRPAIQKMLAPAPPSLASRFPEGSVADAWLAAYDEHLAEAADLKAPSWVNAPTRTSPQPWYSVTSPAERALALRQIPDPFAIRYLFSAHVVIPLRLRAGRPPKTAEEKRQANAARQRRFRTRRALELELLQHSLREV